MTSFNKKPQVKPIYWEKLSVSSKNLGRILVSILKEGVPVSFIATGISMKPFIQDGDKLIIKPLSKIKPSLGKVVAFINPKDGKLLVHRIIAQKENSYLIKGDYSAHNTDGWMEKSQIVGYVSSVIRNDRKISFGLGLERYAIAILSKMGLLTKIVVYFNKWLIRSKKDDNEGSSSGK